VHVLHQIAWQCTGQQGFLRLYKGPGCGIGLLFQGLAAQDRPVASV
jgi:hypothetical protein